MGLARLVLYPCVLRITTTATDRLNVKLEGRLVGPWVEELKRAALATHGCPQPLEIDVTDLLFADEEGEAVLNWLHNMGARFRGKGASFAEFLFERLGIPLRVRHPEFDRKDKKGGSTRG
jgi:hypothetical protein